MAKVSILGSVTAGTDFHIPVPMKAQHVGASGELIWKTTYRTFRRQDLPLGDYETLFRAEEEPLSLGEVQKGLWLFRGKVVLIENADHLSAEEQRLEIMHAVLKHEQRYERLRRQVDAYARFEKTESARRERIPDEVKRFVWQRDQGKCVRCGSNKRLEFDHIIPISKGGSNTERNIQLLCEKCNREKGGHL
jgi:5-methylcytosine-specific restriction endonuclease McrA